VNLKNYQWLWRTEGEEIPEIVWWAGGVTLAVLLRFSLWNFENYDTRDFLVPWYNAIVENGRWRSFRLGFSNYTPPYLYLLTLATYLPVNPLHAVKLVSFVFDLPLAYYAARLVALKYEARTVRFAAFFAVLFAPTVFCNSALWGQCDAMYTTFLLGSLYYLLRENLWRALLLLGLALSFKLQAVFLLPLYAFLYLRGRFPLRYWLLLPGVYLATILPAGLLGRPWRELLTIYAGQAKTYPSLTQSAANFYQWIPQEIVPAWNRGGVIFTAGLLFVLCYLFVRSRAALTNELLLRLAMAVLLLVPFTLPRMHERYFFAADVLAVVYAFYFPRRWYLPLLVGFSSLLSYAPFLYGKPAVNLAYVALAMLAATVLATADLLRQLFPAAPDEA
jgi:Gpi18-like mannosyltransferase